MRIEQTHWIMTGAVIVAIGTGVALPQKTNAPLMENELLAQVLRFPNSPGDNVGRFFKDSDPRALSGRAAAYLGFRGIVHGFPDGTFKGHLPVNRAEAVKMLLISANIPSDPAVGGGSRFIDIRGDEWFAPFITTAAELGIVSGYSDETFRPARSVSTAEFLKMATLTFELPEKIPHSFTDFHPSEWFRTFAGVAWEYHLYPESRRKNLLEPYRFLSRDDVAIAIMQILTWGSDGHVFDEAWKRHPWGQPPLSLTRPNIRPSVPPS